MGTIQYRILLKILQFSPKTVEPGYRDIDLYDASSIVSDIVAPINFQ